MKKVVLARPIRAGVMVIAMLAAAGGGLSAQELSVPVIPIPVSVKADAGPGFKYDGRQSVHVEYTGDLQPLAETFRRMLEPSLGYLPRVSGSGKVYARASKGAISLGLLPRRDSVLGREGYRLRVNGMHIVITANEPAGLFYGMQTLLQLLGKTGPGGLAWGGAVGVGETGGRTGAGAMGVGGSAAVIPAMVIEDYPRFGWRGLMLDVSRHFFSKEVVKAYIDQMVKYKFNVFHWHLSDDQGWRIEIKSMPALTKIGAWRVPRTGQWWTYEQPKEGEKTDYGGYYTQEDIKEVVRYAAERYVTILPEIDVPGHSLAMIAAYPSFSSTGLQYAVNPGSKFYGQVDNALCPGNEKVFEALDTILGEVASLFPGAYIHIGGDEAYKGFWKDCPKCRQRMQDEKLKNVEELQSYFVKRLEKILASKHKRLIGWDEILEGGLAPSATVMSWRGMDGGVQAARQGHSVIMTPSDRCYLDLYQGDPLVEPDTYSSLRLEDCYGFEPVPEGLPSKFILGGQANLWTESVYNERHVQYMTWPRSLATAEVLWSPREKKDWKSFTARMEGQFGLFDAAHVNFSRSAYDPIVKMITEDGEQRIAIRTEVTGLEIHYSFDNGDPDRYYPLYSLPLTMPAGATWIRVAAFRNGDRVGRQINFTMEELAKRAKK